MALSAMTGPRPVADSPSAQDKLTLAQRMTVLATGLGCAITGVDPTIFNSNLVAVQKGLDMSTAAAGFTASLGTLTMAAAMLGAGTLGDIYGKRRMYLLGLIGVIAGGLLAAVSVNAVMLMATRALTGVFFAFLLGLSLAIVNAGFSPGLRAKAISLYLGTAFLVAAPLPLIGNVLVESLGWRWGLLVAPAAALITIPITLRFVPETPRIGSRRIDYAGIAAAGLALVSLVYGLSRLAQGLAAATLPLVVALAAGTFFVWWEQRIDQPALELRIFRAAPFNAAVIAGLTFNFLTGGLILVLGFYLTVVRGYSPTTLGLLLVLSAVVQAPAAVIAGRMMVRTSARATILCGLVLLTVAANVFATFDVHTPLAVVALGILALSTGVALVEPPQASLMMSYAPVGLGGSVAAVKSGVGQSFYSLGPTVVTLLSTAFYTMRARERIAGTAGPSGHQETLVWALHTTSLMMALVPLAAAVAVWLLLRRDRRDPGLAELPRHDTAAHAPQTLDDGHPANLLRAWHAAQPVTKVVAEERSQLGHIWPDAKVQFAR